MITEYPSVPCPGCGKYIFWYREPSPDKRWKYGNQVGPNGWVCSTCSPAPDPSIMLKSRILRGNVLINKIYTVIRATTDPEEHKKLVENMVQATERMRDLMREFKNYSTDCLYIEGGKKLKKCLTGFTCYGCPNSYWPEREMMLRGKKVS